MKCAIKYKALTSDECETVISPKRTIVSWRRKLMTGIVVTSVGLLFYASYITSLLPMQVDSHWYQHQLNNSAHKYTIDTEGCSIPEMHPFDETVKKFYKPISKEERKCGNQERSFLKRNRTHIWVDKANIAFYNITDNDAFTCCYKHFFRPDTTNVWKSRIDERIQFDKRCIVNFNKSVEIKHEFVNVTCKLKRKTFYTNLYLSAVRKEIIVYKPFSKEETLKNVSAYNVIILGIDNVSRMNLRRTMPKTVKYLKNKEAVELLGYTKVGLNSFPNIVAMLTGNRDSELEKKCLPHRHATFDFCPFLWTWYKRAGYYTAFGEDTNYLGTFTYLADGFFRNPTDYYMHPFTTQLKGECVKEKFYYEVLLQYVEDIMWTVKASKLFGFFWSVSLTHDDLNAPTLMDDTYLDFFKRLETSKLLDNTVVLLVSDHGARYGGIRHTKQGRLEERLPFVFILTPTSFRSNHSRAIEHLKMNAHHLTTPFDVHETLLDLIDLRNITEDKILSRSKEYYSRNRGISLFLPIPKNRTCQAAGIDEEWCCCIRSISIPSSSKEASQAGQHLIEKINLIMASHKECLNLTLDKIMEVTELLAGALSVGEAGWREYFVAVQARPGGGTFEGTLRHNGSSWAQAGVITRTSRYGNQSYCVDTPLLRQYCYCK